MQALTDRSILDKILKTPVGGKLTLTPAEADAIMASKICMYEPYIGDAITRCEPFQIFGRTLTIDYN
jgi:hypothetical protein